MAVNFGQNLLALLGSPKAGVVTQAVTPKVQAPKAFKTAGYSSIPYERAPQVRDTVPTEGLLPGYSTPKHVWVA